MTPMFDYLLIEDIKIAEAKKKQSSIEDNTSPSLDSLSMIKSIKERFYQLQILKLNPNEYIKNKIPQNPRPKTTTTKIDPRYNLHLAVCQHKG
jgi:hypothetical protein